MYEGIDWNPRRCAAGLAQLGFAWLPASSALPTVPSALNLDQLMYPAPVDAPVCRTGGGDVWWTGGHPDGQ